MRAVRRFALPVLAAVLAAAFAPRGVRAAAPAADPGRVVARYIAASGGAAALAAERALHTHAIVEAFGFKGTLETWSEKPSHYSARTELGPFKLGEGSDGVHAWRTDPTTGRVATLTDRDSLEAMESAWFALERWAEPNFGGGTVKALAPASDAGRTYTVLEITAPGGARAHRLWFDDATGLPDREESSHDQMTVVTHMADWRTAAGRMRAFTVRTEVPSMPANTMVARLDSVDVNGDMSAVPFAAPLPAANDGPRWLTGAHEVELPFDYRARHVWLKASIGGGPAEDFLFDTGASVTVLDSTFAATHGLAATGQMQAAGAGAAGSASFATLPSLTVKGPSGAGVELRDVKVAVMSVNPMFTRFFWGDMAGVLGYDFISRFVTTIDYDRRVLVLHDPKTFAYAGREAPLPMKLNGVVPSVDAVLDGRDAGEFRLDVGSSSTVDVHGPFAVAHGIEKRLRGARPVSGAGFGGGFTTILGRLKTMAIGPYAWDAPMVSVASATEGAFASRDFAGNIGNRVLERFRVTLDYDHRRVYLEPGARYRTRDAFTRTGFMLGRGPEGVEVISVLPASPAWKAGVREGDVVTAVDGRAAGEWTLPDLDRLFDDGPDGRRVPVRVTRDGVARDFVLTLREMLR